MLRGLGLYFYSQKLSKAFPSSYLFAKCFVILKSIPVFPEEVFKRILVTPFIIPGDSSGYFFHAGGYVLRHFLCCVSSCTCKAKESV